MAAPHETPIVLRDIGTGVGDSREPIIRGLEAPFIATAAEYRDGSRDDGGGSPPSGDAAYTITGTGFGTKPATTPVFEDFESESLGAFPAGLNIPIGELILQNNEQQATSCTTNNPKSGTRCIEQDYSATDFPRLYRPLSGTSARHYFACDLYWSGVIDTDGTVWKFGRIGASGVYSGDPKAGESWGSGNGSDRPGGFGGELRSSAGIIGYGSNASELDSTVYDADQWHFYELEFYAGTPDGDDCFFEVRVNGAVAIRWEGFSMLTAALSDLPDWILTPLNGLDLRPSVTMWMDNVYSDESRARVVMTDSPVYANSTKWAVQPLQSYSDTSIGVAGKRQGFAVGETAYLHAFNHLGVLVSEGTQVTVIED